jgi:acyl carrier protein
VTEPEGNTELLGELTRIVHEQLALERELQPGDDLVGDLALDSLALLQLLVAVEDHFQVKLSDRDTARLRTVGDLCHLLARRQNEARQ